MEVKKVKKNCMVEDSQHVLFKSAQRMESLGVANDCSAHKTYSKNPIIF